MPYLPEALDSVAAQTYDNYEVIVQDGASTDGTLEVLRAPRHLPLEIESGVDGGVGAAYNRAIRRCRGEIVGSIDADNLLLPDALETAVAFLTSRPDVAAAYGGSNMMEADGKLRYRWMAGEFDLLRLLTCELVPPFAVSFFSRDRCGDELRFDEALKTCADFDLWLRISHLPIARVDAILGSTRLSPASMTRRVETYEQYIADKSLALERYLERFGDSPLLDAVRRHAVAGINVWAAESVYDIEQAPTLTVRRYLERAASLVPDEHRVIALRRRVVEDRRGESIAGAPTTEPALPRARRARVLLGRARRRWSR